MILAGGFLKAIIWLVWAIAATTKVAHARRVLPSIVIVCCVDCAREEKRRWLVLKIITLLKDDCLERVNRQMNYYIVVAIATTRNT